MKRTGWAAQKELPPEGIAFSRKSSASQEVSLASQKATLAT